MVVCQFHHVDPSKLKKSNSKKRNEMVVYELHVYQYDKMCQVYKKNIYKKFMPLSISVLYCV